MMETDATDRDGRYGRSACDDDVAECAAAEGAGAGERKRYGSTRAIAMPNASSM